MVGAALFAWSIATSKISKYRNREEEKRREERKKKISSRMEYSKILIPLPNTQVLACCPQQTRVDEGYQTCAIAIDFLPPHYVPCNV